MVLVTWGKVRNIFSKVRKYFDFCQVRKECFQFDCIVSFCITEQPKFLKCTNYTCRAQPKTRQDLSDQGSHQIFGKTNLKL